MLHGGFLLVRDGGDAATCDNDAFGDVVFVSWYVCFRTRSIGRRRKVATRSSIVDPSRLYYRRMREIRSRI